MILIFFYLYIFWIFCVILIPGIYNPIHAIIILIFFFFFGSFCLFLFGIDFLSLIFLMIYIGAIIILFLFFVMLLNIKDIIRFQYIDFFGFLNKQKFYLLFFFKIFIVFLANLIIPGFCILIWDWIWLNFINLNYFYLVSFVILELHELFQSLISINYFNSVEILGEVFFIQNGILILMLGVILFIAMVGVIIFTLNNKIIFQLSNNKKQFFEMQILYSAIKVILSRVTRLRRNKISL